jgi:DNA segregation ATPase FtsK/SpoIIIE-like protein
VVIGERSGRRAWELRLDADHDGNHGLIAGGTGSGKSELLMTLIVELALNYDPSVLNFVLVDYKGGGAFEPFRKLPHCVDVVTNLNKAAVKRMFTAIDAEIRRRQRFQTDIIEYRRLGRKDPDSPYPHLVIIIDEYAEMITNNPEFRDQLDSIARVGRSLGINLILASQRPTGVSDQMRANIKLRICLRVQDAETSRELLRRPDAAHLPSGMPGRGYVQVETTQIDLVQVAWTGETINGLGTLNSGDVGLSEDQKRAVPHKF